MSVGLYSHTTRATGTVLTAAIYNSDHQNHITNQNPAMTGAYSDNVAQMQSVVDPGGVGSEDIALNLAGELERIRFAIKRIVGEAQWYVAPAVDLATVNGDFPQLTIAGEVNFAGDLSPAQITANQNDYTPAGHATAFRFRINSDAARNITGLAGGAAGRIVGILNIGAFAITLTNDDAASAAGNRFLLGSAVTIPPGLSVYMQYDSTASRWRAFNSAELDNLAIAGYRDFSEIAAPANPAANVARMYSKDDGAGLTQLFFRDSAGAEYLMALNPATKAIMEAAASLVNGVSPGRQHQHPGALKAVAYGASAGGTLAGATNYNIASIVRNALGRYTVTLTNAMASASYGVLVGSASASASARGISYTIISSSVFEVAIRSMDNNALDGDFVAGVCGVSSLPA